MDEGIKPVVWTTRATKDLEKITKFYIDLYGHSKARDIAENIQQSTSVLENPNNSFSDIGAIDETFAHLKYKYRKLINHHCKITYREGRTKIYIVRVFDTRQHPRKNK